MSKCKNTINTQCFLEKYFIVYMIRTDYVQISSELKGTYRYI